MNHIYFCSVCKEYTMLKAHCSLPTQGVKPVKFSPEDPVGKYRREAKREVLVGKGLL